MSKIGIENLKKAVHFVIGLGEQTADVLADGKVKTLEMLQFIDELMELPGVVSAAKAIEEEVLALDEEGRVAINAYVNEQFDIPNDRLETIVKAGLDAAVSIFILIESFKAPKA